ncbi:MAG: phosphate ABC transporter substrate-binding protein PstS [Pseudonocardiaceae bacterium]
MRPRTPGRHRQAAVLAALVIAAALLAGLAPSAGATAGFVPISGSGSTWSSNAQDQWRRNVASLYGMTVNFSPNGSTSGRNDFRTGQVDYAVSEIPFGLSDGGVLDPNPTRAFGYMPIVAGGTSFMYNLHIGGKRVTNLRLSGLTLTKIFTQVITNWSDPAIQADNPGLTLPARKIVPVVYSNGSGTAAQFTAWMANQYPALWDDYCHRNGKNLTPCGFTSFYPIGPGMEAKAQSQGVAGFVAQDTSEGAITFVEYSYARNAGFPVAKLLNKAGYFVEPTAGSVAVALLQATINPDLTANLTKVYVDRDPRTYPMSSYSYMILPKDTTSGFNTNKGATLSTFAAYFLCEGQQQADTLGYSPLPINLVQDGVDQINQIPVPDGYKRPLDRNNLAHCNNPSVSPDGKNLVAENAPQPSPCDKLGAPTQCTVGTAGAKADTPISASSPAGKSAAAAGNTAGGSSNTTGGANGGTSDTTSASGGTPGDGTIAGGDPAGTIDPNTGQLIGGSSTGGSSSDVAAVPVSVDAADNRRQMVLAIFAAVLLLGLVLGPPLVARTMHSREGPPT